jgi:putative phosphoesterase
MDSLKVLILSDSHGNKNILREVINSEKPDKIFFLGDHINDIYSLEKSFDGDICAVKGNVDYGMQGVEDLILSINGYKMLLTHGHKYRVKFDYYSLYLKAREYEVDFVFFGHTHACADFEENGIRFMNPGSIAKPRDHKKGTYLVMNLKEENIIFTKKLLT